MIDTAVEFPRVKKQYKYKHFTLDLIDLTLQTGCMMGFVGAWNSPLLARVNTASDLQNNENARRS